MSVRKRRWTTAEGEVKEAWIVDYVDQDGDRHIETFRRKKEADAWADQVGVDVRAGTHTAASRSATVAEAAEAWIKKAKDVNKRERSTVNQYEQHAKHIIVRLGANTKLSTLTRTRMEKFADDLLTTMSRPLAKKVLVSVKSMVRNAVRLGKVSSNAAADVKFDRDMERGEKQLEVGVDIPTPAEIKHILDAVSGRLRPLLITATFTGLRASELRGLPWKDVDLKHAKLHVRQRADRYKEIGSVKSKGSKRTLPLGPMVVNTLREWKLACPRSDLGLVFPTESGQIQHHKNIVGALQSVVIAAGLTVPVIKDGKPVMDDGKPVVEAKYTGLHALRHFYASLCINRKADGGLELPPKNVQARMGHAKIAITMDTYGHLFPGGDDGAELAKAERALLA